MKVMTETEVIKDTLTWYLTNPRGVTANEADGDGYCVFNNGNGGMCALGRVLKDTSKGGYFIGKVGLARWDLLKTQYRIENWSFWNMLREFHNESSHWKPNNLGGNDLTERGQEYYNKMLESVVEE